jgi:hypothetical protein
MQAKPLRPLIFMHPSHTLLSTRFTQAQAIVLFPDKKQRISNIISPGFYVQLIIAHMAAHQFWGYTGKF